MGIFDEIQFDQNAEKQEDTLGGGFAKIEETGKYDMVVKKAFFDKAKSGAMFFEVHLEAENGAKLRQREYFSNKAGETFYIDKKSGNKRVMPGYAKMQALDYLISKVDRPYPPVETKQIELYDYTAKKEIPQSKDVPMEWINKPITVLVMKKLENKQAKNESTGNYEDTAETVEKIEIEHYLDPVSGATKNEIIGRVPAEFASKFLDKFGSDYVRDNRSIKTGQETTSANAQPDAPSENPFE